MATIRYRHNSISSLIRDDGSVALDHEEKARIFWHVYRDCLGTSFLIDAEYDFSQYLHPANDLEELSL
jgi:hypothetical protein